MTHIDLFSGIGGFAYAAQQVWPDYRNLFFCDNNKFCQAVLHKNFGRDSLIYGDIREVTVERVIADTEQFGLLQREHEKRTRQKEGIFEGGVKLVDLLTGGFPCQPFSAAGKRKGRDDERHLWPEMFRVIKAFRPRWVIGENVRGLVNIENGMALQQVFLDLESIGYAVQAFIIPACAVNAPHRRDRIWIVAHAERSRAGSVSGEIANEGRGTGENRRESIRQADGAACSMRIAAADCYADNSKRTGCEGKYGETEAEPYCNRQDNGLFESADRHAPDPKHEGHVGWRSSSRGNGDGIQEGEQAGQVSRGATSRCGEDRFDVGNSEGTRQSCGFDGQGQEQYGGASESGFEGWGQSWLEVATRLCRVDDGLSTGVDGLKLSKSKHREERLKALGNAIVPQVAIEIMRAIKECE